VNRELETYLRRATRGLWGKKRLEVREELTQHVLEKAHGHEVGGLQREAAIARALTELGDPRAIRSGMIGVHTMPKLFRNTAALGLFAAISLTALNSSRAQIEVVLPNANLDALSANPITNSKFATYLLSFESIKQNLEGLGIVVDSTAKAPVG
jgi:hypothetical protein